MSDLDDDRIGATLRSLPREAAAPDFTASVLARLEAETVAERRTARGGMRRRLLWTAAGMAVASLALVAGLALLNGPERPRPAPAATTAVERTKPASSAPPSAPPTPAPVTAASAPAPGSGAPAAGPATARAAATAPEEARRLEGARAELAELRRRHQRFASDLREVSNLAGGHPVVYLGGDEGLEMVLDLRQPEPGAVAGPRIVPAAGSGGGDPRPAGGHGPRTPLHQSHF